MSRRIPVVILLCVLTLAVGCTNKKVSNPLANVGSKQPDKVLFDRAMDAMKHNRFDVARLTLEFDIVIAGGNSIQGFHNFLPQHA